MDNNKLYLVLKTFTENSDIAELVGNLESLNDDRINESIKKHADYFELSSKKITTSIVFDRSLKEQLGELFDELPQYLSILDRVEDSYNMGKEQLEKYNGNVDVLYDVLNCFALCEFDENEIEMFKKSIISLGLCSRDSLIADKFKTQYYGLYRRYFAYNIGNLTQTNYISNVDMLMGAGFYVANKNILETYEKDILFFSKNFSKAFANDIFFLSQFFDYLGFEKEKIIVENGPELI
jgi:hypothetical protein